MHMTTEQPAAADVTASEQRNAITFLWVNVIRTRASTTTFRCWQTQEPTTAVVVRARV